MADMPKTSGDPTPHEERKAKGQVRVDLYVPAEAADDLKFLTRNAAKAHKIPLKRARTPAIVRAIKEQAARDRKKLDEST